MFETGWNTTVGVVFPWDRFADRTQRKCVSVNVCVQEQYSSFLVGELTLHLNTFDDILMLHSLM